MRYFWVFLWYLSELTGIGLGRFAPFVFAKMGRLKGRKITRSRKNIGAREMVAEARSRYGDDAIKVALDLEFRAKMLSDDISFAGCGLSFRRRAAIFSQLDLVSRYARFIKFVSLKTGVEKF
jgi:hypothetical protein